MISVDSLKEKQLTFQLIDGGAIPTSTHQLKIRNGSFKEFSLLLDKYHYKNKKIGGNIEYNLVLEYDNIVYGGCVIGRMRHEKNYHKQAVELRRMVLSPNCPKNTASYFLSKIIWWLKKNTEISTVYTFADMTVGHKGTCYKAANFEYVKTTPPTYHILWKGKRYHPRSLTIDRPYSYQMRKDLTNGSAKKEKGKSKILYKYDISASNITDGDK